MIVLVTGAAGFIGAHLTKKLLLTNHKVIGIDNLNNYYSPLLKDARLKQLVGRLNPNFVFFKADLLDKKIISQISEKYSIDSIVHLAAQPGVRLSIKNPDIYQKNNIEATLNILELARFKKTKLIFSSSSSVYGETKIPFTESDPCNSPASFYGATKKAGEVMAVAYHNLYGIKTTILRFFTVYGPWGRPDMAVWDFCKKINKGEPVEVYGKGTQRDFTYIDDIIAGIESTIKKDFDLETINLGNSKPENVSSLVSLLEKNLGKKARIKPASLPSGDVSKTYANIEKAKKLLSWSPQTTLAEGIRKFVDWYRKEAEKSFFA